MRTRAIAAGLMAVCAMTGAQAATVLSEGFDNVAGLSAAGWVVTNNSTPVGEPWFQGGAFASQSGSASSFVGANFLSAASDTGAIDNWLITPVLTLTGGETLSFYTRTADPGYQDVLKVFFNAGASSSTSSFTSLLLTVGNALNPFSTSGWTQYTVALPTAATGRIAFEYTVPNALDADAIGIDSLVVASVPEPATMALFGLGLAAVGVARRRKLPA